MEASPLPLICRGRVGAARGQHGWQMLAAEALPTATRVPALAVHAAMAGGTPVTRVTGTAARSTVMLLTLADGRF